MFALAMLVLFMSRNVKAARFTPVHHKICDY